MSKLYASLFLLANIFTSLSNGDACANAKLTCNTLTIKLSNENFASLNGVYTKVENENNLYQKGSDYFSYYAAGGYYTIAEKDNRCLNGISYSVRAAESELSSLTDVESVSFTPTYPSGTVSIACEGVAAVTTESGLGSVCFTTSYTGTLNSGSGISTALANLAGQYTEIANSNGKPAYELSSGCNQEPSTLMYITQFAKYGFVRDVANPSGTYYATCSNSNSITNNDITQCEWGSLTDLMTVSSGSSSCDCGLTPTPPPTDPPVDPVSGLGSVCFSTTTSLQSVGQTGGPSYNLADLAGAYEEIENINGKPAYQLSSTCSNGNMYYIIYSTYYTPASYMMVTNKDDVTTYFNSCGNPESITNNDITQCTWTSDDKFTLSISSACQCGVTITPAPTDPPVDSVSGLGSVCFTTTFTGTLNSGSGISTVLSDLAGEYTEIANINGKPAYQLSTGCNQASSTLMYITQFAQYGFVRDVANPSGSYYTTCSNSNDDVTQCEWGSEAINALITVSTSHTCQCGLTPTPAPTKSPVDPVPLLSGNICFAALAGHTISIRNVELSTISGPYAPIDDINGRSAYQLSSTCGTAYIVYNSQYGLYGIFTDKDDPTSYMVYCTNTASIAGDDITGCTWTNSGYYTVTDTIDSCTCGQTVETV